MSRKRLVVVIPGIGGSILRDRKTGTDVWSHGLGTLTPTLHSPERLDLNRDLEPVGLLQDIQVLPGWAAMQGYTSLWQRLSTIPGAIPDDGTGTCPAPDDATLIAFPHDFRRSNKETAAALEQRVREQLHRLGRTDEPNSVIVVAHSMGGLIARYWIARLGGAELCHALLTLGTPHRGAPKALDVFAHGTLLRAGPVKRRLGGLTTQLTAWDSMKELLPRYPCIEDPRRPGQGSYVHDLDTIDTSWRALAAAARHGWDFHQEIEHGWAALKRC